MPFNVQDCEKSFKDWIKHTKKINRGDPWVGYLVAYISLERYLKRTAKAIHIFHGIPNVEASKKVKKSTLKSLVKFCGGPKGNAKFLSKLKATGLWDLSDKLRVLRNDIAHGRELGNPDAVKGYTVVLWKSIRSISNLRVKNPKNEMSFCAWQKMPVKQRPRKRCKK